MTSKYRNIEQGKSLQYGEQIGTTKCQLPQLKIAHEQCVGDSVRLPDSKLFFCIFSLVKFFSVFTQQHGPY